MMIPMTNFFVMLEPKICTACNRNLEEMADCYMTVCDECSGTVYYPLSPIHVAPQQLK